MYGKLCGKVLKRIKFVGGIKVFVIFAVRAFHFSVVPRRIRFNEFMSYSQLFEASLKQRQFSFLVPFGFFNEFQSVVRMYALYFKRKGF